MVLGGGGARASVRRRLAFDRRARRRLTLALAPPPPNTTPGLAPAVRYQARFEPATVTVQGPASVLAALPEPWLVSPTAYPQPGDSATQRLTLPALPEQVQPAVSVVRLRLRAVAGRGRR